MQQGRGLRLRLSIDPSLSDLPWEFLCAGKEFIGLNLQTPIVRFIEQPTPIPPLKTGLLLKILVVIAGPGDRARLDTEAEKERIAAALDPLQRQGTVKEEYLEGPNTWPRLIDALRPDTNHILHFVGHGAFDDSRGEGVLLMEDAYGDTKHVGGEQIKVLMLGKRNLRLAVLNSCLGVAAEPGRPFSSAAAALVRAGLPAVVAMQFEISDRAARVFSETLYQTLSMNFPIEAALTEARRAIAPTERDSLEWATPVLFMQVAEGRLFNLEREARSTSSTFDTQFISKLVTRADEAFDRQHWTRALECYRVLALRQPKEEKFAGRIALIEKLQKLKSSDVSLREQLIRRAGHCELQLRCVNLFARARRQYEGGEYTPALSSLGQLRGLNPQWPGLPELQTLCEGGRQYHQALNQLKAGRRDWAADLLRQVVARRPSFRDAAQRLKESEASDGPPADPLSLQK